MTEEGSVKRDSETKSLRQQTEELKEENALLLETMEFFLKSIAEELKKEIDWRAKGYGKNPLLRAGIYTAALLRDLIRIPLHHKRGIGQAQFRFRVDYIINNAIPTLKFFQTKYPLEDEQQKRLEEAINLLQEGVGLIKDGSIQVVDEWYATMEEFYKLTKYSKVAALNIENII